MPRPWILHAAKRHIFVIVSAIALTILGWLSAVDVRASTSPAVSVGGTSGATLSAQLSTNDVWSGMVDQAPGGQASLNALHAPYVRIHVGDDGWPEAMPEIVQNQWSFASLDALVNNVFAAGEQPLMNIKFAPDWQWTCTSPQTGQTGSVRDTTFQQYAQYMARLVSYYNKGSVTTETGTVITNPAGTSHAITYWEPWNEPDLNNETPCAPSTGVALTPTQYVTMWNAVTAAMLQVDPTLKFVGPATAGAQFGSSTTTGNDYVDQLMAGAVTKPAAISFHGYGYWDNTVSDKWIFDGDNSDPVSSCCGGVTDLTHGITSIRSKYPDTPVWLTEVNVNADWGNDSYKRPWSEFAAAWWATAFQQTAPLGVGVIHEYDIADSPQFGMIDDQTGDRRISYYVFQLLDQAFPAGSTMLSSSSTDSGILSLAARKPDGTVSVMVIDRKVASDTVRSSCGAGGVATPVTVSLSGIQATSVTLQQLDKTNVNCSTAAATPPTVQTVSPSQSVTLNFPGYGVAVLSITPGGQTTTTTTTTSTTPTTTTTIPTTTSATATTSTTPSTSTTTATLASTTTTSTTAATQPPTNGTDAVSGVVYVDSNRNGVKDSGEAGYPAGTPLSLAGAAAKTTTSSSSGGYAFSSLADGSYSVSLTVPSGYTATTATSRSVTLISASATKNFGIAPNQPAATGGLTIYDDSVGTGFKDNTFSYSWRSVCDKSTFTSGSCSYGATFQNYGAFEFRYGSSLLSGSYKSLDFDFRANGQAIGNFGVVLSTSTGGYINEYILSQRDVVATLSNGWVHVSIPLTKLDPSSKAFSLIDIENARNSSIAQVNLDNARLLN
jgi:hypothetical protein